MNDAMWRCTFMDSTPAHVDIESRHVLNYASSATRTLICLILMFLLTIVLTLAGIYEHVTNICLGILFLITIFFIVYSMAVKRSYDNQTSIQEQVWRTSTRQSNNEECSKAPPPSYETVIKDPAFLRGYQQPPPSYSIAIASCPQLTNCVVLDVTKLPVSSELRTPKEGQSS